MKYYLGIDIGGTNTAFAIVNQEGEIFFEKSVPTNNYLTPAVLVKDIYNYTNAYCKGNSIQLEGVGIGAPNANHYSGCIEFAPNLKWGDNIPIASMFEEQFKLPVKITNDANAAAIGEKFFGGAKQMNDFVVLTLGTGLGSGIYVNGNIVHGKNGFAGEFGHTKCIESKRICNCGKIGCLETFVSSRGIIQTYKELYFENHKTAFTDAITTKEIFLLAQNKDPIAIKTYEQTAILLGRSLSQLILILDPEAIFLFGGIANAHQILIPTIEKTINDFVLPTIKGKIKILPSELLNKNAAILGSVAMFFS